MRIVVFGAGMMSRAAVHAYLAEADVEQVVVADRDTAALDVLADVLSRDERLAFEQFDATDASAVSRLMARADGAFCGVHYDYNVDFTQAAIAAGTHMVDLGGNNDVVAAQRSLDEQARNAGACVTPDCGLAPGLASMLVAWGVARFGELDAVQIRVGGLPSVPQPPFEYGRLFSTEGLINEYVEPPLVVRDHQVVTVEPLGDAETISFPDPIGTLVAFNTSGGLSTLGESFAAHVCNMDYQTLRLPGHDHAMRWLLGLGLMSDEPIVHEGMTLRPRALLRQLIEAHVPVCDHDRTIVRVSFQGSSVPNGEHVLDIVEEYDAETDLTAMARLTAWPAVTISLMQCREEVAPGVLPQETSVDADRFLALLGARGVRIAGLENVA